MGKGIAMQCNLLQTDRGICLIACYGWEKGEGLQAARDEETL